MCHDVNPERRALAASSLLLLQHNLQCLCMCPVCMCPSDSMLKSETVGLSSGCGNKIGVCMCPVCICLFGPTCESETVVFRSGLGTKISSCMQARCTSAETSCCKRGLSEGTECVFVLDAMPSACGRIASQPMSMPVQRVVCSGF